MVEKGCRRLGVAGVARAFGASGRVGEEGAGVVGVSGTGGRAGEEGVGVVGLGGAVGCYCNRWLEQVVVVVGVGGW